MRSPIWRREASRCCNYFCEVDGVSPDELPVAVYTDKNFNFLPSEDLNTLYRLGAHSVHKDRDEDPSLQISPSSEYFRLSPIERARSSVSGMRGVFISHGRSPDWMRVQMFLQNDERLSTVEREQLTNEGRTVIEKLNYAANRCSHAVIVMTGDDQGAEGTVRVRENVMDEIGFFQGRLGL